MATTDVPPPASKSAAEPAPPRRWVQLSLVVGTVLLGLGIIVVVPWLRHSFVLCLHGDFAGLRVYIKHLGAGGLALLIGYRLTPVVPFSFMGYAAGAVGTNLWTFAWTTIVGFLPLTVAVTCLGSRAQSLSRSDPLVWAAVALLLGLIIAAHRLQHSRPS